MNGSNHGLRQRLTQHLTHRQKLDLRFGLVLELILALRRREYKPEAECPKCLHELTPLEILKGFSDDPTDFRTTCPKCMNQFEARLRCREPGISSIEFPFLCPGQALNALAGLSNHFPELIEARDKSAYHSAIVHFGSLRNAFRQLGMTYELDATPVWKDKVLPFLGELPDRTIGRYCGVSATTVRKLRQSLGIAPFRG